MPAAIVTIITAILSNPALLAKGEEAIANAIQMAINAFHLNKVGAMSDADLAATWASVVAKDKTSTDTLDAAIAAHKAWKATLPKGA